MQNKKLFKILTISFGGVFIVAMIVAIVLLALKVQNLEQNNGDSKTQVQDNDQGKLSDKNNLGEDKVTIVINSINDEKIIGANDCIFRHAYPQLKSNVEIKYLKEVNEDLEKYSINSNNMSDCDTDVERWDPTMPYYVQDIWFEATNISGDVFCFVFDKDFYMNGAAHPERSRTAECYDLRTERKIDSLDDFLTGDYKDMLVRYYETQIPLNYDYPEFWSEGFITADEAFERVNFYIKDGELVLYWQTYDIAPGVMGVVEVTVPTDELSEFYTDDSLMARF